MKEINKKKNINKLFGSPSHSSPLKRVCLVVKKNWEESNKWESVGIGI